MIFYFLLIISISFSNDCNKDLRDVKALLAKVVIKHVGDGACGSCDLIRYKRKKVVLKRFNYGTGTEEAQQLKEWRDFFDGRRIDGFDIEVVKVYDAEKTYIIREYIPYHTLMHHVQNRHTYSTEHQQIVRDAEYISFEILRQVNKLKQIGLMKGTNLHYGNICLNIISRTLYIIDPV